MESLLAQEPFELTNVWVAAVTLLSIIATSLFQIYRENRNHRWDEQRRVRIAAGLQEKVEATALALRHQAEAEALAVKAQVVEVAAEVVREADNVRHEVERRAFEVRQETKENIQEVQQAIKENTEINVKALSEANNFNKRLQQALHSLDTVKTDAAAVAAAESSAKVDRIQEVVEDNNEQIRTARVELEKLAKEARE